MTKSVNLGFYFTFITKVLKPVTSRCIISRRNAIIRPGERGVGFGMKKWIGIVAVLVLLACVLAPGVSFTEDGDALMLARVIYALARSESYDTQLAIGTVVMNRMDSEIGRAHV